MIFKQNTIYKSNSSIHIVSLRDLVIVQSKVNDDLLLTFLNIKSLDTTNSIDNDLLLAILLDNISINHVAHQLGSSSIICCSILSILDS